MRRTTLAKKKNQEATQKEFFERSRRGQPNNGFYTKKRVLDQSEDKRTLSLDMCALVPMKRRKVDLVQPIPDLRGGSDTDEEVFPQKLDPIGDEKVPLEETTTMESASSEKYEALLEQSDPIASPLINTRVEPTESKKPSFNQTGYVIGSRYKRPSETPLNDLLEFKSYNDGIENLEEPEMPLNIFTPFPQTNRAKVLDEQVSNHTNAKGPDQISLTSNQISSDQVSTLIARISELIETIRQLQEENQNLRHQMSLQITPKQS